MTMVTLTGEFRINGIDSDGMTVDTTQAVRFNDASGLLAIVAVDNSGKAVKGVTFAVDEAFMQLAQAKAVKDVNVRVPEAFR